MSWPRSHSSEASEPRTDSKFFIWVTFAYPWNGPRQAQRSQLPQDWLKEQLHHITTALGKCIPKAGWGREVSACFPCQSNWPATAWYVHCITNFKVRKHYFHQGVFFSLFTYLLELQSLSPAPQFSKGSSVPQLRLVLIVFTHKRAAQPFGDLPAWSISQKVTGTEVGPFLLSSGRKITQSQAGEQEQ